MDKLQQYYESLPLCTGNTPGNVMFSVYGKHGKIAPVGTDEIDPVKTA